MIPPAPKGKNIWGSVAINDRGQIVIPKGARDLFGLTGGQRLIVSGGEVQTVAEWAKENRPDESEMWGLVVLEGEGLKEPQPLALRYIGKALYAAQKLGRAERLELCEFPVLALRGPGWAVYIARSTDDHTAPGEEVTRIRLDEEAANA